MPRRPRMPEENRDAAQNLAVRAAGLTAEMSAHAAARLTRSRERDRLWYEASALGMSHTMLAQLAGVHHKRVDEAVLRHRALLDGAAVSV